MTVFSFRTLNLSSPHLLASMVFDGKVAVSLTEDSLLHDESLLSCFQNSPVVFVFVQLDCNTSQCGSLRIYLALS